MRNIFRRIISTVLAISVCLMLMPAQSEAAALPVAAVGEDQYTSLDAAIEAAAAINGMVDLLADLEVRGVVIPAGVTLNLGEHSLKAGYLVGLNGSCLTATPNAGRLIVKKGSLVLAEQGYKNASGQYILPIWDPEQNCYLFSLFVVNTDESKGRGLFVDEESETIRFQFKHQATGTINKGLLGDGAGDNALKVIVRLVWESENGEAYQDFVYNDGFVRKVAVGENGVSFDYSFTLSGYSAMNINLSTLRVVGMIITDSGAVASGTVWTAESGVATHTVTFVDYDGSVLKTQEVKDGESATAPPEPTRDGYTFIGWDKAFDHVTSDLTVTAQYNRNAVPTLVIVGDTVNAGSTRNEIVVEIINNPGILGMNLKLEYDDSAITITRVSVSDAMEDLQFTKPKSYKNGCNLVFYGTDVAEVIDGEAFIIRFDVVADAPAGRYTITLSGTDIKDVNKENVALEFVAGEIIVVN